MGNAQLPTFFFSLTYYYGTPLLLDMQSVHGVIMHIMHVCISTLSKCHIHILFHIHIHSNVAFSFIMSSYYHVPLPLPLPVPINTELPLALTFLSNPISYYFNAAPPYNNVTLGVLLFTPPPHSPRLLLLQRAGGTDPHTFSGFWQIPSGSPKPSDPSMLHALARIIYEQTGLRLTSVVAMCGAEIEPAGWETAIAQRMRMQFVVQVAELGPIQPDNSPFGKDFEYGGQGLDVNSLPITLNLAKHRQHVWSREADLKDFINSGLYPTEMRTQYRMMLEACIFHNRNLEHLDSLNQQSQSTGASQGFHI